MKRIFSISMLAIFIVSIVYAFSAFNEFPDSSSKSHEEIDKEFKHLMDSVIAETPVPVLVAGIWTPG